MGYRVSSTKIGVTPKLLIACINSHIEAGSPKSTLTEWLLKGKDCRPVGLSYKGVRLYVSYGAIIAKAYKDKVRTHYLVPAPILYFSDNNVLMSSAAYDSITNSPLFSELTP